MENVWKSLSQGWKQGLGFVGIGCEGKAGWDPVLCCCAMEMASFKHLQHSSWNQGWEQGDPACNVAPPGLFFSPQEAEEAPLGSVQNRTSEFSQKHLKILVAPSTVGLVFFFLQREL